MKTETWIIFICAIAISFYTVFAYNSKLTHKQTEEDITVRTNLTVACSDSLRSALEGHLTNIFEDKDNREYALTVFYDTLCACFNFDTDYQRQMAKYYVPCGAFVGWDGYYMFYTERYSGDDGYEYYADIITDLRPWIEKYGSYYVQYKLDGTTMVSAGMKKYKGTRKDILAESDLHVALEHELSFFKTEEAFNAEKNDVIINTINNDVQYFINTHNDNFNTYEADYIFTMPEIKTSSARDMKTPTVLGFFQGYQRNTGDGYINIFSLSASDVNKADRYYMQEETDSSGVTRLYYHVEDCDELTDKTRQGTMEECAEKGAYPCECCYGY